MLFPSVALGQEPGVTFDDGPSGKEYAIPLDSARRAAKRKRSSSARSQPTPSATTTPAPALRSTTTPAKEKDADRGTEESRAAVPAEPPGGPPANSSQPTTARSGGPGAGFVIGGLALAALALGGLAGLILRRRRSPIEGY